MLKQNNAKWNCAKWDLPVISRVRLRKGKQRGNCRMEWVASTFTLPQNVVYLAVIMLMRTPRLPAVDWTDVPTDMNVLVSFSERRNLVSVCVPSDFKRTLQQTVAVLCYLFLCNYWPWTTTTATTTITTTFIYAHTMLEYVRSRDVIPLNFNLGCRWKCLVRITSQAIYPF